MRDASTRLHGAVVVDSEPASCVRLESGGSREDDQLRNAAGRAKARSNASRRIGPRMFWSVSGVEW